MKMCVSVDSKVLEGLTRHIIQTHPILFMVPEIQDGRHTKSVKHETIKLVPIVIGYNMNNCGTLRNEA